MFPIGSLIDIPHLVVHIKADFENTGRDAEIGEISLTTVDGFDRRRPGNAGCLPATSVPVHSEGDIFDRGIAWIGGIGSCSKDEYTVNNLSFSERGVVGDAVTIPY